MMTEETSRVHPGDALTTEGQPVPEEVRETLEELAPSVGDAQRDPRLAVPQPEWEPAAMEKLTELQQLLQNRRPAKVMPAILELLRTVPADILNYLVVNSNIKQMIRFADDGYARGPLMRVFTEERIEDLSVPTRWAVIDALQRGRTDRLDEESLWRMLLGTSGADLTMLKNLIDACGTHRDLSHLVHHDIDDGFLRSDVLRHIREQARVTPRQGLKVLSDIDDTIYCNWKDRRYPKKTVYPGVRQFLQELDRGPDEEPGRQGDLVFLTARPGERTGWLQGRTRLALSRRQFEPSSILHGSILYSVGRARIASMKFLNFQRYKELFPEYDIVFVGDSGEGDVLAGKMMRDNAPDVVRAVFIHDIKATARDVRATWRNSGVYFFDTYLGAAIEAFDLKLIHLHGLVRVARAAVRDLETILFRSEGLRTACWQMLRNDIQHYNERVPEIHRL